MALTISVAEIVEKSKNPLLAKHESWSRVLLGEIATIQNGFAFKSSLFIKDDAIPLIRIRDVGKDQTETNYNGEYDPSYIVEKGDLLVGMDGDFNCDRWRGQRGLLNQRVCRIKLTSDMYHPKLLDYALPGYLKAINDNTSSVTVKHLSSKSIAEIPLPLPPMEQQKLIVDEIEKQFSRLDEAVAGLKRVKANLKRYKAAVLKAAVEGKLTEEWRRTNPDVEPASELLKRILAERKKKWETEHLGKKYKEPTPPDSSNLPELPKGWVWTTLEQLLDDALIGLDRGRSQQSAKPNGTPYIKMNNITMDGKVIFDDLVYVKTTLEEIFRFNVKDGDLLFNTRNSKELVGKVGLVKNLHVEAIYNNNLMRIRMPNSVKSNFICAQMCSLEFRRRMELVKKATTNVAAIYAKDLFPLPVALPPSYEQELIMAEVERLLSVADEIEITIEFNLKRAERLRQSILKKAFSGSL